MDRGDRGGLFEQPLETPARGAARLTFMVFAAAFGVLLSPSLASVEIPQRSVAWASEAAMVPPESVEPIPVSLHGSKGSPNPLPSVTEAVEYGHLIRAQHEVAPLDSGLLGESVDYFTGETDFVATDVSLSGGSALSVAIGRRYHVTNHAGGVLAGAFGDWDLDIPHVEGVVATDVGWTVPGAQSDARCTYFGAPPPASVDTDTPNSGKVTTTVPAAEYSLGFTAVIPGMGRRELLLKAPGTPAQGNNDKITTKELWAVSCIERNNSPVPGAPDEGFVITTPDGITYTFRQAWVRPYSPLTRPADTSDPDVTATVDRQQVWMLPTKVEDRFGNTVTYAYQQDALAGIALKTIIANDGRKLTVTYNAGRIKTITDGARTWTYSYAPTSNRLQGVALPDGSAWIMDLDDLDEAQWTYDEADCGILPTPSLTSEVSGSIQHPSGAKGLFTFQVTRHGRYGAPDTCLRNTENVPFAPEEPNVYDVLSLKKKRVTGPQIDAPLNWSVAYAGCAGNACNPTATTTVTNARSYKTLYTFGTEYGSDGTGNEGMLLRKQSGGTGGTYLQDEQYAYFNANGQPYPSVLGTPSQVRGDVSELVSLRPVQRRTLTVDGATYTRVASDPDIYGFPRTISRTGTSTKVDAIIYSHDAANWVLGTVKSVTSDHTKEFELAFNAKDQPIEVRRFGRLDRKFDYYNDGSLHWIRDGHGNQTTLRNYSFGIPRSIDYADGTTESVEVASFGKITSHTDALGLRTTYTYDDMHRLRTVVPPGSAGVAGTTTITWLPDDLGWSRTIKTGDATTTDVYDAFLRAIRTTDSAGREIDRKYDPDGRATFESYPTGPLGITSAYDAIGRLTRQTDDQHLSIEYVYGANTISIKDRDEHWTKYGYVAYDGPSTAWPVTITPPWGTSAITSIVRDLWGKPTSLTRHGIQRSFAYNTYEQLKSVTEPETGATSYDYDDVGNVETVTYADGKTATHTYDLRNRPKKIVYSDGSASVDLTWNADGSPKSAVRGGIVRNWSYSPTSGLPIGESIVIEGVSYAFGYAYDANRHPETVTYPDSSSIDLAPDDLGRPTKAGTYATNVVYFENDALKSFTYGNGIAHDLTQYTSGRPKLARDAGVLSTTYTYDGEGNPLSIVDSINSARSRTLTYDSNSRLQTAQGPWGTTTLGYDVQDNLTDDSGTGLSLTIDAVTNLPSSGSLSWDERGRLKQRGTGSNATQYAFDAASQLTRITQGGNTWSYTYDALGYRAIAVDSHGKTISVYDSSGRLMYEAAATGNADRIFQGGFEAPAAPSATTKYVYLGNHLVAK